MKTEIELQPFRVPNYVLQVEKQGLRQEGFKETPKFHLSELSPIALSDLCDQFRGDVFAKANKKDQSE